MDTNDYFKIDVGKLRIKPYEAINSLHYISTHNHEKRIVKYFDDQKVLRENTIKTACELGVIGVYCGERGSKVSNEKSFGFINPNLISMAVSKAHAGITYDEFIDICKNVRMNNMYSCNIRLDTEEFEIKHYVCLNEISPRQAVRNKKVKYFDDKGILQVTSLTEAYNKGVLGVYCYETMRDKINYRANCRANIGNNNLSLFKKAVNNAQEGITYDEFLDFCKTVQFELGYKYNWTWLDRFVASIETPIIERATGNENKKSFDFVRVSVLLNSIDDCDVKTEAKKHFAEIKEMVIKKIAEDKKFKKYGIPVNVLRLTKATLTCQDTLEMLFELKEISK